MLRGYRLHFTCLGEGQDYQYLGIAQAHNIKYGEMKVKLKKKYAARVRKILKSKLNGENTVTTSNTWAVALLRYTAAMVYWTKDELFLNIDRHTRELLRMHGAQHPKAHVDRLSIPRRRTRLAQRRIQCVTGSVWSIAVYS